MYDNWLVSTYFQIQSKKLYIYFKVYNFLIRLTWPIYLVIFLRRSEISCTVAYAEVILQNEKKKIICIIMLIITNPRSHTESMTSG